MSGDWWKDKPTDPDRRKPERSQSKADLRQFWAELLIMATAWALLGLLVWALKEHS